MKKSEPWKTSPASSTSTLLAGGLISSRRPSTAVTSRAAPPKHSPAASSSAEQVEFEGVDRLDAAVEVVEVHDVQGERLRAGGGERQRRPRRGRAWRSDMGGPPRRADGDALSMTGAGAARARLATGGGVRVDHGQPAACDGRGTSPRTDAADEPAAVATSRCATPRRCCIPTPTPSRCARPGRMVIERGEGVRVFDQAGRRLHRGAGRALVLRARLRQRRARRGGAAADGEAALLPPLLRQEPRAGGGARREDQGAGAGADGAGLLPDQRLGGERHPGEARLVLQQRARPAGEEEDRQPGRRPTTA